ncbi:M20/M25/M40 family metallo-hydrolase [Bradyrhizobium huanghuaihaiense]|uniref:M20/M25/M40 family metallo-hydrolase n=1 Tax=Bradyrhizobium huanghuaihaiense TaxID=990078 RepID=UPI0021A9DA9A|nr:M20/M25/M40 family metallo-hydrolase [Bradyrhizobium sp. CB3035]UWU76524.1 M20/M25/M40 family metallo-hydrolase [Bradyrhizobium sp. CB3035]
MQAVESNNATIEQLIVDAISDQTDRLIEMSRRLVNAASPNPPGDVAQAADVAEQLLLAIPGMEVERVITAPGIVNLIGRLSANRPGRRLVFNGHLDTFPIGEDLGWTVPPLDGTVRDGLLFGRGVSDMKGGIAASLLAVRALSAHRDAWAGEVVVTLAGDEETMGSLGTRHLLEHFPHALGDAMISGDVGSPMVVRFGEKGLLWVEIEAEGSPAHGAHVHKGVNAIDRLRAALDVLKQLEALETNEPPMVAAAIQAAEPISEPLSGVGEASVLRKVTVNIGVIEGGVSPNLIPTRAVAKADIRLPVGLNTADVETLLRERLATLPGVQMRVVQKYEPSFTDPSHEIVEIIVQTAEQILQQKPAANMRVGASDARLYRMYGIPSVVFGPTPYNMGGPDEHIRVDELISIAKVHALAALRYLSV